MTVSNENAALSVPMLLCKLQHRLSFHFSSLSPPTESNTHFPLKHFIIPITDFLLQCQRLAKAVKKERRQKLVHFSRLTLFFLLLLVRQTVAVCLKCSAVAHCPTLVNRLAFTLTDLLTGNFSTCNKPPSRTDFIQWKLRKFHTQPCV